MSRRLEKIAHFIIPLDMLKFSMSRLSIQDIMARKAQGERIVMLTAYDYPFARLLDEAEVDIVLVGDSLAMVVQGLENTLPVSMQEMLYHTRMVSRAVQRALVVGDMPYLSYQLSIEQAVLNAGRFLKEAGAQAVKVEGGLEVVEKVRAMVRAEIPVMAHIGLTPQAIYRMGGFKVQGRDEKARQRLKEEALALQEAGAFSLLLEAIPMQLAQEITQSLSIPTIGIGAGPHTDGQVLVLHDLLGLFERFRPKFVKQYANLRQEALRAIREFRQEVREGRFPTEKESFK